MSRAADPTGRPEVRARPGVRWSESAIHALAAAVVVAGVAAQVVRPVAPDLGSAPAAHTAFDASVIARAAAYRQPVYAAAVVALLIRLAIAVTVALTPWGRRVTRRVVGRVGRRRPARAAAAVILAVVVVTDVVLLPLVFWIGFVHDGAYGLRTQGLAGWVYDWVVFHGPVWFGVAVLAVGGYAVAGRWPRLWPPVAGLVAGILAGLVTFVSPLVLEPLTHRFTPLEPGAVRTEVQRVLAAADQRVDAILVADASRRTTRQNAYVSGLGSSERVVLYDTLVASRPAPEVGLVLAHELAHDRNGDIWRLVLLSAAGGVVAAYVIAAAVTARTRAGRQAGPTDPRAAAVVLLVALLLNAVGGPVQSLVSRRAEAAADLGALELSERPDVFVDMQIALATANLTEPAPPRWVTLWRGSHPSPMARIGMARWWERQ